MFGYDAFGAIQHDSENALHVGWLLLKMFYCCLISIISTVLMLEGIGKVWDGHLVGSVFHVY